MRGEMNGFFSVYIHMKGGSLRKTEELVEVKDNSDTRVIVRKLDMNTFRLEIRMSFLLTRNTKRKKRVLVQFSKKLNQLKKGLHCLRLQEIDSQLQEFPSRPTFLYFQKRKTKVCIQIY